MLEADLPEDLKRRVEEAKRAVWTQKGAAKEYQYFAYKANPVLRLKNLTEIAFVTRHITGKRILDAGAGTGRFAIPLRRRGLDVTAVDISTEMLSEGVQQARRGGDTLPCAVGLVDRLPFADDLFDSVVSITVLRHFPDWMAILDEYARIVRPGGRIVFDLASGDQREYMRRNGMLSKQQEEVFDPLTYESAPRVQEVLALAEAREWSVVAAGPHDFFNANPLLNSVLGGRKASFEERLHKFLESDEVVTLCELLSRRFLFALSPVVSASWLVVLEKGRGHRQGFEPAGECRLPEGGPFEQLLSILQSRAGRRFDAYVQEAGRMTAGEACRDFLSFLGEELLPRFPLDALIS